MKYRATKKDYFEVNGKKYRIDYEETDYNFKWCSIKRKILWFFYEPIGVYGPPEEIIEYLGKVKEIVEKMDSGKM